MTLFLVSLRALVPDPEGAPSSSLAFLRMALPMVESDCEFRSSVLDLVGAGVSWWVSIASTFLESRRAGSTPVGKAGPVISSGRSTRAAEERRSVTHSSGAIVAGSALRLVRWRREVSGSASGEAGRRDEIWGGPILASEGGKITPVGSHGWARLSSVLAPPNPASSICLAPLTPMRSGVGDPPWCPEEIGSSSQESREV